jgi:hypothetical protein
VLDLHAEEVDIEFSRAREIFDMKNHMVNAGDFEWRLHGSPPKFQIEIL